MLSTTVCQRSLSSTLSHTYAPHTFRTLLHQHSRLDNIAMRKLHEHPGSHPYRIILNEVSRAPPSPTLSHTLAAAH